MLNWPGNMYVKTVPMSKVVMSGPWCDYELWRVLSLCAGGSVVADMIWTWLLRKMLYPKQIASVRIPPSPPNKQKLRVRWVTTFAVFWGGLRADRAGPYADHSIETSRLTQSSPITIHQQVSTSASSRSVKTVSISSMKRRLSMVLVRSSMMSESASRSSRAFRR